VANRRILLGIAALDQCFSTGGPQNYFSGPAGFSHFIKNQVIRQRFHKNYKKSTLSAAKASRNNKNKTGFV